MQKKEKKSEEEREHYKVRLSFSTDLCGEDYLTALKIFHDELRRRLTDQD
jgi:hypothetical protein